MSILVESLASRLGEGIPEAEDAGRGERGWSPRGNRGITNLGMASGGTRNLPREGVGGEGLDKLVGKVVDR